MSLSKKKKKLIFVGSLIGLTNGLFGGGGGIIAVSLLKNTLNYPTKKAHATSLLIILPLCVISATVYLLRGYFLMYKGSFITLGVVLGGLIGVILLKKLPEQVVKNVFTFLIFLSGIKLLFF